MSHPRLPNPRNKLTDAELKLLVEDVMNTPKLPNAAQKLATVRLLESNKQAARDMLLRMQLGLKPATSNTTG